MQFIWNDKIFAHYLYSHYSWPFAVDQWWHTFDHVDNKNTDLLQKTNLN